ncbi:MAG: outer membrane beta-barrel protein, partial [Bacteroidales bacterium]|nr:outer membrane beta-barrel protein [Bacteroidales bacterium]
MKQFDDLFRENIKKVFGSYNADHLAGEGWNSFVYAKKARNRRMTVIPLLARAASVFLIIGLGVFVAYRLSTRQPTREIVSKSESMVQEDRQMPATPAKPAIAATAEVPSILVESPVSATAEASSISVESSVSAVTITEISTITGAAAVIGTSAVANDAALAEAVYGESRLGMRAAESSFLFPNALSDLQEAGGLKELHEGISTGELIPAVPESTGTASGRIDFSDVASGQEKLHGGRALIAGFSGLLARSAGSASPSSGLSAGLYLDQKITRRISIRPGLALARQSFGLVNGSGYVKTSDFYKDPPLSLSDGTGGKPYSYDGKLNMLAMEVPLNIVFRISDRNGSGFYVSAGASTMIYLSQQFTADFVNEYTRLALDAATGVYATESRFSTFEFEKDYGAFSRTDFFGLANFSAGYTFTYAKTGTML